MPAGRLSVSAVPVPQQDSGRDQRVPETERGHGKGMSHAWRYIGSVLLVRWYGGAQECWHVFVDENVLKTKRKMSQVKKLFR